MSTATLTLTDTGGAIDAHIEFGPAGFQKDSHAHQHAMLLVKHMDDLCKRLDQPKAKTGILLPDGQVV